MEEIQVYKREISDGVGELVKSTASVAYCSEATLHKGNLETAMEIISDTEVLDKVVAENQGQIDLHYIESVLVSTGWNKNDDVFRAESTWEARNTPEDKQFNYGHDENDIIGHITGSYVLSKDGKAVSRDQEEPPEDFDIITQAVIYNSWTDSENRDRMEKIISEISEGKWFVSMECLFAGFDYALINPEGEAQILARGEESAFLTKHLRAYGGTGEYEGYKVGRALNNISFSGKGLVSKPANPRSVILNSKSTAQFKTSDMNSNLIIGDINMSDTTLLEKQLADVQAELATAKEENEAIKAKIEEAKDKEFASVIANYEASADTSKATISELEETIKSTKARVAELEDALTASQNELSEATNNMNEMKAQARLEQRKAALIEAGLSEEEVEEKVSAFDSLEDEAFQAVIAMWPKKDDKKKKEDEEAMKMKPKAEESEAELEIEEEVTAEVFEEVESSEATLVESQETDEVETTRASVADWFSNNVLSK